MFQHVPGKYLTSECWQIRLSVQSRKNALHEHFNRAVNKKHRDILRDRAGHTAQSIELTINHSSISLMQSRLTEDVVSIEKRVDLSRHQMRRKSVFLRKALWKKTTPSQ